VRRSVGNTWGSRSAGGSIVTAMDEVLQFFHT
jgi:hypothetical protein